MDKNADDKITMTVKAHLEDKVCWIRRDMNMQMHRKSMANKGKETS